MGYGFVIDQRKCIGCHACTVACKAENDVPLGDFRTWVKYTEKGEFPEVRRHFTVLRCNHCDAAPCVEICPVTALHKRPDAIVDLDRDICIGCRACMQACPYDALYLNEEKGTAEKCHYCAHRTEVGLEPACVIVCPEQAIVAGDLDDPNTRIARLVAEEPTSQRRLDKGTKPRVHYVDALPESLEPGRAGEEAQWIWADRAQPAPELPPDYPVTKELMTTLNVDHAPAWGWHVWVYLVTKNIAAGAMMAAPFLALPAAAATATSAWLPEVLGLGFLAATFWLLIDDLGRPERFWRLLFAPNTRSWLVRGAWVLSAFGGLATASLVLRLLGADGAADLLRWIDFPVAALASGYSAWLFGQCRGRDLWIERGLFVQLVLRAAFLGGISALFLVGDAARGSTGLITAALGAATGIGMLLEGRRTRGHARSGGRAAAILAQAFRPETGGLLTLLAAAALAAGAYLPAVGGLLAVVGTIVALIGMLHYERTWIRAGQAVPNS